MKKLLSMLMAFLLLASVCMAEDAAEETEEGTAVTLTIGDITIPAVLNHTVAAQDLIARMPVTIYVDRGSIDFCGSMDAPLGYVQEDFRNGFEYGDLIWMPDGNWFVIFTDGRDSRMQREWLVLGHMDDSWEQIKELTGSVEIVMNLAETQSDEEA